MRDHNPHNEHFGRSYDSSVHSFTLYRFAIMTA